MSCRNFQNYPSSALSLIYYMIQIIKYSRFMRSIFNNILFGFNKNITKPFVNYLSTPIGKITLFNSLLFLSWNAKDLSQSFLVNHFSFERYNIEKHRLYTALTYSFSHLSSLHFAINMIALQLIGKRVQLQYGSKYVWGLYIAGAFAGSIAMNFLMPYDTIPMPKVGADPCISAFFSFLVIQNPHLAVFNLFVPIKLWFLLACGTFFVVVSDSSCKNLGGLAVGAALGLIKRRFLL